MRHKLAALLLLSHFLWAPLAASAQPKDIPIAPDVSVEAPAADIPKELAAFSGKWFGPYNGVRTGAYMSDALIIVERISSATSVQVFYSGVGRFRTNHGQSWAYRLNGAFIDGTLQFKVRDNRLVECKLNSDGTMSVTTASSTGSNRGTFRRLTN